MFVYTKGENSNGETFILLDMPVNIFWLYLSSVLSVHPPGNLNIIGLVASGLVSAVA